MKILSVDSGREPLEEIYNAWRVWPDLEFAALTDRSEWYHKMTKAIEVNHLPAWNEALWGWKSLKEKSKADKLLLISTQEKLKHTERALKAGWQVIWLETPAGDELVYDAALTQLSSRPNAVIALTPDAYHTRLKYGWSESNLRLCPPAIKLEIGAYEEKKVSAAGLKLGVAVDLSDRQRLEDLVRLTGAASELGLMIEMTVIGEGAYKQQLSWLVKKMNLERQVLLVGWRSDLEDWIKDFDYLVIANYRPGLSDLLAGIKALALSVPLLGPDLPVSVDLIRDGQNGRWLDWNDFDANLALLKSLAADPKQRKQLSSGARKYYLENFDYKKSLEAWRKTIYE